MTRSDAENGSVESPPVGEQWETRHRDDFAAHLMRWYPGGIQNFSFDGPTGEFRARVSTFALEDLRLVQFSNSGAGFDFFVPDTMSIDIPIGGNTVYATRKAAVTSEPGKSITQYGEQVRVRTAPGYAGLVLLVSDSALLRQANVLMGTDRITALQDLGGGAAVIDMRKGPGTLLTRHAFHAFNEAEALSQEGLGALIRSETYAHLTNLVLVTALPKLREQLAEPAKWPGTQTIERARECLAARSSEPVRIAELANELGTSMRALQIVFRRHLGLSPRQFLFQCRLHTARDRLLGAPAGATVTSIAMECGFSNLGAFAARYHMTFGELPSETLRRRQRAYSG